MSFWFFNLGMFCCSIQEPDDAYDYFQMARENCKKFAFVHVSFAQFELSQGNLKVSSVNFKWKRVLVYITVES